MEIEKVKYIAIALLGGLVAIAIAIVGVSNWLVANKVNGLMEAVNDLEYCYNDGNYSCQIENDTDGTYSVYALSEEL